MTTYADQLQTLLTSVNSSYRNVHELTTTIQSYCTSVGFSLLRAEEILDERSPEITLRRVFKVDGLPEVIIDLIIPLGYSDVRTTELEVRTSKYNAGPTIPSKQASGIGASLIWSTGEAFSKESLLKQIYNLITGV
jgi:hypothetical protein